MCAPLTDMSKDLGEKPVAHHALLLIVPVNRFALLVGKTRPTRNSWREVAGEVHNFLLAKPFVDRLERFLEFARDLPRSDPARSRCLTRQRPTLGSATQFSH